MSISRRDIEKVALLARLQLTEDELNHVSGGSFTYGAIEWTYTKQKADGTSAGNVTGGWDLVNNKVHA